jgi:predicted peptidase
MPSGRTASAAPGVRLMVPAPPLKALIMRSRHLAVLLALGAAACSGSDSSSGCIVSVTNPCTNPIDTTGGGTNVATGFQVKTVVDAGVSYGYQVFIPANYNTTTAKIPVILFLHGSGEKGTDNVNQTNVGLGPLVKALAATFPAIVVFPQGPPGETAASAIMDRIAVAALDQVIAQYPKADPTRLYMTGLSYGGIRGYEIAYQNPTKFAAFVPISASVCGPCLTGSASTTQLQGFQLAAQTLKALPIWQFQGALDPTIKVADTRVLINTFIAAGSSIQYTEYADLGHESWDRAYATTAMWAWLYLQHR